MKKFFLFTALLSPAVVLADIPADIEATKEARIDLLTQLHEQTKYDDQSPYAQSILNIVLPRIASTVTVCDGHRFYQDADTRSLPVAIYDESPIEVRAEFTDSSDDLSTADKLNGYQWTGRIYISLSADAYRPINAGNWLSGYENQYSYGSNFDGTERLVIYKGELLRPKKDLYQTDSSYASSSYFRLQKLKEYTPLTCDSMKQELGNYNRNQNISKGLGIVLGVLGAVTQK